MSARKGTIVMLHGWAQNAHVMRVRTAKLEKKLNQAGYQCVYPEAPHLLPKTSTVKVDGLMVQVTNGERENARAWFLYSREDSADASMALKDTPMEYIGLDASIDVVKECLEQCDDGFCAMLGFSQGATMCHILSIISSVANRGDCSNAEGRPFAKIDCAILMSGFPHMHKGPLAGPPVESTNSNDKLDMRSLHVYGERDTSVPKSYGEKLAECFVCPEVYDHGKGHLIPQNNALCETVIHFLDNTREQ